MSEVKSGEGLLVTYTFRFGGPAERKAFEEKAEKLIKLGERVLEELVSENALEGGRSLLSTINRYYDQLAYEAEARARQNDTSTALMKKIAEGQEEERKARAAQVNVMNDVHRRLKHLEAQESPAKGGVQSKAPFRDAKNKPHPQNRSQKVEPASAPPAAPTTSAAPQRAKQNQGNENLSTNNNKNEKHKETAEKFSNPSLKEEVEKFAQHQAGP